MVRRFWVPNTELSKMFTVVVEPPLSEMLASLPPRLVIVELPVSVTVCTAELPARLFHQPNERPLQLMVELCSARLEAVPVLPLPRPTASQELSKVVLLLNVNDAGTLG